MRRKAATWLAISIGIIALIMSVIFAWIQQSVR
jgi:hypothetical protein